MTTNSTLSISQIERNVWILHKEAAKSQPYIGNLWADSQGALHRMTWFIKLGNLLGDLLCISSQKSRDDALDKAINTTAIAIKSKFANVSNYLDMWKRTRENGLVVNDIKAVSNEGLLHGVFHFTTGKNSKTDLYLSDFGKDLSTINSKYKNLSDELDAAKKFMYDRLTIGNQSPYPFDGYSGRPLKSKVPGPSDEKDFIDFFRFF